MPVCSTDEPKTRPVMWMAQRHKTLQVLRTTLVAFTITLLCCTGCRDHQPVQQQNERLTFATLPWPGSLPAYVGIDRGYFQDEGLDVTLKTVLTGKMGIQAVLGGQAEVAGASTSPIASSVLDGDQIAVVATIAEIQQAVAILARKGSGIAGAGDLRGKVIGVTRGTGAHFFLHYYLVINGIRPDDVTIVDIEPDKVVDALLAGEVDAVSTWSPFKLMLLEKLGTDAVVLDDPALSFQTFNLVTSQEFAKNHQKILQMFLHGLLRANSFIQNNPSEAQAIMKKYVGIDSPLFLQEWPDHEFTLRLGQAMLLNLEDQARWMLAQKTGGIIPNIPNSLDFIDTHPLQAVNPEAVRIIGR